VLERRLGAGVPVPLWRSHFATECRSARFITRRGRRCKVLPSAADSRRETIHTGTSTTPPFAFRVNAPTARVREPDSNEFVDVIEAVAPIRCGSTACSRRVCAALRSRG